MVIALIMPVVCFACTVWHWFMVDKRCTALVTAANERERELAAQLEVERIARAEQHACYAERLAAANERERILEEKLGAQIDADAPIGLAGVAERAATLVLAELPIESRERERMATCAALGGLMTAHHFVGVALNAMLKKADLGGDIFHLRYDDGASDEIVDDEDDRDSDPSNMQ